MRLIPFTAGRIRSWAEKTFGRPPNAIVLTHGHFDHVGDVKELAEEWNVPIYAHSLEFPYLTGQKEYPAPNWAAGGGVMPLMSPTLPRGPIDVGERLRALPGEGSELSLAELPGWTLLHTPGHTPGHVSFFREERRCAAGREMRFARRPRRASLRRTFTQKGRSCTGRRATSLRTGRAAKVSVRKLSALDPTDGCSGARQAARGAGGCGDRCAGWRRILSGSRCRRT